MLSAKHNEEAKTMLKKCAFYFRTEVCTIYATESGDEDIFGPLEIEVTYVPAEKLGGCEVISSKIIKGSVDALILLNNEEDGACVSIDSLKRTAKLFKTTIIASEFDLRCFIDHCAYVDTR